MVRVGDHAQASREALLLEHEAMMRHLVHLAPNLWEKVKTTVNCPVLRLELCNAQTELLADEYRSV